MHGNCSLACMTLVFKSFPFVARHLMTRVCLTRTMPAFPAHPIPACDSFNFVLVHCVMHDNPFTN
eukprot:m.240233 g.240233  ORF g.240233 m.240233 type:complete len:65 (-) comp15303_c0_seq1:1698-1892(-)